MGVATASIFAVAVAFVCLFYVMRRRGHAARSKIRRTGEAATGSNAEAQKIELEKAFQKVEREEIRKIARAEQQRQFRTEAQIEADVAAVNADLMALNQRVSNFKRDHPRAAPADVDAFFDLRSMEASLDILNARAEALQVEAGEINTHKHAPLLPADAPPAALDCEAHVSQKGNRYYRNEIPPPLPEYPQLAGGGGFYDYELHGEDHHVAEISAIVGGPYDGAIYFRTNVLVAPEPANAYDPNAVAIYLGGKIVGYVPKDDASAFGAEMAAILGPGAAQCRAEVSTGAARAGQLLQYRVKLDIARPLRVEK